MTYPTVTTSLPTATPGPQTTHNVDLPASNTDDMLVMCCAADGPPGSQIAAPEGWVNLSYMRPDLTFRYGVYGKISSGSEPPQVQIETESPLTVVFDVHVIADSAGFISHETVRSLYPNVQQSNSPNHGDNLTVPWGTEDTLWLNVAAWIDDAETVTVWPTGWTHTQSEAINDSGAGSNASVVVATAAKLSTAGTEPSLPFTISGSERWVYQMIAIRGVFSPTDDTEQISTIPTSGTDRVDLWYDPDDGVFATDEDLNVLTIDTTPDRSYLGLGCPVFNPIADATGVFTLNGFVPRIHTGDIGWSSATGITLPADGHYRVTLEGRYFGDGSTREEIGWCLDGSTTLYTPPSGHNTLGVYQSGATLQAAVLEVETDAATPITVRPVLFSPWTGAGLHYFVTGETYVTAERLSSGPGTIPPSTIYDSTVLPVSAATTLTPLIVHDGAPGDVQWIFEPALPPVNVTSGNPETHTFATAPYTGNVTLRWIPGTNITALIDATGEWSFDVDDVPKTVTTLSISSNNNTINGQLADLPPVLEGLTIRGGNTVTGDLSDLPDDLDRLTILGESAITAGSYTPPTGLVEVVIIPNNPLTAAEIDTILVAIDALGTNDPSPQDPDVRLDFLNPAPGPTGQTAKTNLISRGWSVDTN